jgi:16S rRNA (adenine1518-N6/adenine1519-N6)-dimethyltransferase
MRQNLGQHFLTNGEVLRKIAETLEIQKGEVVIEIGPGHGELTQFLIEESKKTGGKKIIVIEKDPELASQLPDNFGDSLEIHEGDALKLLPEIARALKEKGVAYKLAGNIPYYLTGFLFRLVGDLDHKPTLSIFTMQKEVAERLVEEPPRMNRLAAAIQWWADPKIIGVISREDFDPAPEVDSATVLLAAKESLEGSALYYTAVRALFQQPRKTISNNLIDATQLKRNNVDELLKGMGMNPEKRPQDLSVSEIQKISSVFKSYLET